MIIHGNACCMCIRATMRSLCVGALPEWHGCQNEGTENVHACMRLGVSIKRKKNKCRNKIYGRK